MASTASAKRSGALARARIVEIAFAHFAVNGYRGASMARIAAEAGLSQPGLLHHFPSKAALLQAVLLERDRRDLAAAAMQPEDVTEMDFHELLDFFERVVRHNRGNRNLVQLAHVTAAEAADGDHPAHEWVLGRLGFLRSLCESAVRRGIDAGTVRPDADPATVSAMLIAASEGMENQWLLDPGLDLVGTFRAFADMLRQAVAPPN